MTAAAVRVASLAGLALAAGLAGPARAAEPDVAPDPQLDPAVVGQFEAPLLRQTHILPRPTGEESAPHPVVRCFSYPSYAVKEVATDGPGDLSISVAPLASGAVLASCSNVPAPGEQRLKETTGLAFAGARGGFLMLYAADPTGVSPFFVVDAQTGRRLYGDASFDGRQPTRFTVADGVLTLGFLRGVSGSCPVITGGAACWSRIGREGRLPRAITALPPPVEPCRTRYAEEARTLNVTANDPSMIGYDVVMTLDHAGRTRVLSRGALVCQPDP